jgi:hypothetical protein
MHAYASSLLTVAKIAKRELLAKKSISKLSITHHFGRIYDKEPH